VKHLPKIASGPISSWASAPAACGAKAMADASTTIGQADCPACLWGVYHFLAHQQNMLLARLRELAGVTLRVAKTKIPDKE
jgi:hypothetical protein